MRGGGIKSNCGLWLPLHGCCVEPILVYVTRDDVIGSMW